MKKNKWFGWALVAIMTGASFIACTNETEEVSNQSNKIKLTSAITQASRATTSLQSTQIVAGGRIGVIIEGAKTSHNNQSWVAEDDGTLTNDGTPLYWGDGNIDIIAYYPYTSDWTVNSNSYTFTIGLDQSIDQNYINSDLLFVKSEDVAKTENAIPLTFAHKLAKVIITLESEDIDDLSGAIISICGTKTSIIVNPLTGELSTISNEAEIIVGNASPAAAIIIPQTVNQGTKFIKVVHNGKTYYYTLGADKTFDSGKVYSFTLNVKEKQTLLTLGENNITDWTGTEDISGDAEEEEENTSASGSVIIENTELSQAILAYLGEERVTINENNYAVMTEADVNDVRTLDFSSYQGNLWSLDGIEKFTNLESLNCSNQSSLEYCNLSQLSNLESLNLTGCTILKQLELRSTVITTENLIIPDEAKASIENLTYCGTSLSLAIEEFTNLQDLGCISMGLTTLDHIPANIKSNLIRLHCQDNQLTSLDLSQFPKLQILVCYVNQITELDLSNTPELEVLQCMSNKISALDITENSELTQFHCGEQTNTEGQAITMTLTLTSTQQVLWNDTNWNTWGNEMVELNVVDAQ